MINNTSQPNQTRTLWIGDIESWMDEKFLIKIFSELSNINLNQATVKNVKIMRDKNTGLTQGYGFVEFESPEIAKTIMTNLNGKSIAGTNKLFKLNWATHGAGKATAYNTNTSQLNGFQGGSNTQQDYSIYVADIDPNVSEEILKEFFMKLYPSVISSKIIVDPITKVSKGYGFIKFKDYNESQRAIAEMNGKIFFSKPLKTNQAAWKKISQENTNSNSNYAALYGASNPNSNSYYQKGLVNSSTKVYPGYSSTEPNTAMYGGYDMNQIMMMYGQMNGNNANFQNYQHVYNPVQSTNPTLSTIPSNNNINSNQNSNINMTQYLQYQQQLYLQSLYQNYNMQGGNKMPTNNYTNNMQTLNNTNNMNPSTCVGNQANSQQFVTYLANVNGYNTLNNTNTTSMSSTSTNCNVTNNNNNYSISKQETVVKVEDKEDDDEKSEGSKKSNRSEESEKSKSSQKSDENNKKGNERKEIFAECKKVENNENSEDNKKKVSSVTDNDSINQIEKNCVTTK